MAPLMAAAARALRKASKPSTIWVERVIICLRYAIFDRVSMIAQALDLPNC